MPKRISTISLFAAFCLAVVIAGSFVFDTKLTPWGYLRYGELQIYTARGGRTWFEMDLIVDAFVPNSKRMEALFGYRSPWFGPFIVTTSGPGIVTTTQQRGYYVHLPLVYVFAGLLVVSFLTWPPRRRPGCCSECGYDLTGNESGVCPECGAGVARTGEDSRR
jgi:hypothetical protein